MIEKISDLLFTVGSPCRFKLQAIEVSFQAVPVFVKLLLLSVGFFSLILIGIKLKKLGLFILMKD